jgi:ubiquinone/menaquinone biosynthesis C-methylase UbiE
VPERERIIEEYRARAETIPADRYAWHRKEIQYWQASTARVCARLLQQGGAFPLTRARIADIGCGGGNWLLEFLQWGARAESLHGIDLIEDRISLARERLPGVDLRCGDATRLPWPDRSFDLVTQFTVFSSIFDTDVRTSIAREMQRVVRPGGHILWYDCRYSNPKRTTVRGLTRSDIRDLFTGCSIRFVNTTLAPPLSRAVARRSWIAAAALESLPFTRTHIAALISAPGPDSPSPT